MNPHMQYTEEAVKAIKTAEPHTWKFCYPRRTLPPNGYMNPKAYAVCSWAHLHLMVEKDYDQLPHVTTMITAMLLAKNFVPTYFLTYEFAQAVARTKPPSDFKFADIKWPLKAFLFCLPEAFVREHFGFNIPFIAVAEAPKGEYPASLGWPYTPKDWPKHLDFPMHAVRSCMNTVDRLVIDAVLFPPTGSPFSYTANYPLSYGMDVITDSPFEDSTAYERDMFEKKTGIQVKPDEGPGLPTPEDDKAINQKVSAFTIKLLTVLTARPSLLPTSTLQRAEKRNKAGEVEREALWNAAIIGSTYRVSRPSISQGGTHAAPRMHWRPGHFTHQVIGKTDDGFVYAHALPRKTEGGIDWASVDDTTRDRFWKNHSIRWIEPVLVNAPADVQP